MVVVRDLLLSKWSCLNGLKDKLHFISDDLFFQCLLLVCSKACTVNLPYVYKQRACSISQPGKQMKFTSWKPVEQRKKRGVLDGFGGPDFRLPVARLWAGWGRGAVPLHGSEGFHTPLLSLCKTCPCLSRPHVLVEVV